MAFAAAFSPCDKVGLVLEGRRETVLEGRRETHDAHLAPSYDAALWHLPEQTGRKRRLQAERPGSPALCLCIIASSYFSRLADGHRDQSGHLANLAIALLLHHGAAVHCFTI